MTLLIPARLGGESGVISLKSELWASRTLRAQAALSRARLFCFVNVSRRDNGPVVALGGLESPALTAGPLSRTGLLRLLFRPLRYKPGSELFGEETGLHLDRSLEGGRRLGLLLQPWPGRLAFFSFALPGRPAKSGGYVRVSRHEAAFLEALVLTSSPEPQNQDKQWISRPAVYPGGRLLHLGARAGCAFPSWTLQLFTALSGSQRTPPGCLAQVAATCNLGKTDLALAGGVCSPAFLTPDGRGDRPRFQGGVRALLGSEDPLQVRLLAELLLLPPTCGCAPALRRENRGELSARLLVPARGCGCWRLEGGMVYTGSTDREAGQLPPEQSVLKLNAKLVRENDLRVVSVIWVRGEEESLIVEVRRRGDGLRWRGSLETRLEPSLSIRGGCALELNRENSRFYARLSCREYLLPSDPACNSAGELMGKLSFTVGWETISALPPDKSGDV